MKKQELKESIIAEYLGSAFSLRALGIKYGVNFRTLHGWVMQYQGRMKKPKKSKSLMPVEDLAKEALPSDVKELQAELRKSRLLNEVLNEVIKVTEEELGIQIRKKPGTK